MKILTTNFFLLFSVLLCAQPLDMDLFKGMQPRNVGPAGMSGRVTAIDAVHSNPDIIYIGTASGGVWESQNGGISWKPIFENEKAASVGSIAINQSNPSEIWVGTGEGNPRNSVSSGYGVYKTIDGGKTWKFMGLGETRNIHRIYIHRDNPNVVWAGAIGSPWGEHRERGVFKTTDGGETWDKVLFVDEKTGVGDLVVDPTNPNKLICAMWEHRRWPWFFKSGGKGSGIHISYDGGENWKQITSENGLPEGELGRIGLAIAPSKPNIVYALIEAEKNGFYKSMDGGENWTLVSTKGIGGRPFYYADIFVDTKNENRIYNLHTFVDMSEDGGKTFERFINSSLIHVDNHAWWSHPEDPSFLICGNDGGMCISRDGGDTWYFPENLPLGQFYHIRVDNEIPFNIYGGMQDNGSWRGPSAVWRRKGIRNLYWNRIGYGDGFDAMPDPTDARFGYSNLQQGSLLRYDLETGAIQSLKPFLEDGTKLRFNWNAAMASDPFDGNTLYYGSQFVLKSRDKGQTWEKISPDLTTNDPEKQNQLNSGGLTLDGTGAENFTTIITIEPSTLDRNLIWVGTDDGNIQITQDGGKTWTNVGDRLKGVPSGSWICQINASKHDAGEAFAVINNYRRDDWTPYLYRTTDFGKTWTRLVTKDQVWGYCLSMVQDPIAPNLLFLGTEFGLYVSIDYGQNWTKWTSGYPTLSTMDLAIQERESDLAIGTFGRAIWVLDDIRPLREIAQKGKESVFNSDLKMFPAPHAWLAHLGEPNGYRSTGNNVFFGENREPNALLTYFVKDTIGSKKAQIQVFDSNNKLIRTFKHQPVVGVNRTEWNLTQKGVRYPTSPKPKKDANEPSGWKVVPGNYKVKITYGDFSDSTALEVRVDPKIPVSKDEMMAKTVLLDRHSSNISKATELTDKLREAINSIDLVNKILKEGEQTESVKNMITKGKELKKVVESHLYKFIPSKDIKGISRDPDLVHYRLSGVNRYLQNTLFPPTPTQEFALEESERYIEPIMNEVKQFFETDWKNYKNTIDEMDLSLIPNLGNE